MTYCALYTVCSLHCKCFPFLAIVEINPLLVFLSYSVVRVIEPGINSHELFKIPTLILVLLVLILIRSRIKAYR